MSIPLGMTTTGVRPATVAARGAAPHEVTRMQWHRRESQLPTGRGGRQSRQCQTRGTDLPGRLRSEDLDLFHAPGYVSPVWADTPVILTVYDLLALDRPEVCRLGNRLHYRALLPLSVRRARRIVVPSSAVRLDLIRRIPEARDRVAVVPPGIDDSFRVSPSPEELASVRRWYELPDEFVLFVGCLEPKKNLERLIAATRMARQRGDLSGELVLVGQREWGPLRLDGRSMAGVRLLGYLPVEHLRAVYHCARLLVFPSLQEGFGLSVIEAMASGLPVVCSAVPALLESDPAAAIRVDPLSIPDIARGLAQGWHDAALRAELIERGRRAAARFTWQAAARRHWRIYEDALAKT